MRLNEKTENKETKKQTSISDRNIEKTKETDKNKQLQQKN